MPIAGSEDKNLASTVEHRDRAKPENRWGIRSQQKCLRRGCGKTVNKSVNGLGL